MQGLCPIVSTLTLLHGVSPGVLHGIKPNIQLKLTFLHRISPKFGPIDIILFCIMNSILLQSTPVFFRLACGYRAPFWEAPGSRAEGASSLPQVWHSIGPRLASLARFRDPSETTFALFGNLRHSSGSVFAHLRIPIGHYRDRERQHEALPFPSGQLRPSTIKLS